MRQSLTRVCAFVNMFLFGVEQGVEVGAVVHVGRRRRVWWQHQSSTHRRPQHIKRALFAIGQGFASGEAAVTLAFCT
jgi:hypothetical protein